MTDKDWELIDELRQQLKDHEARDTFYPFFQNCASCHGYIFGESSDVYRQLGCCGCFVAMEMELRAAGTGPSVASDHRMHKTSDYISNSQQFVDMLLALGARGKASRSELYYHRKTERDARAHGSWNKMKTRQMMTRVRQNKDKPKSSRNK
jgi:hypothetical protein